MKLFVAGLLALFFFAAPVFAQFDLHWLQNGGYWNGGKAEFNIYDAKIVREGQARRCEVIHILVREPFAPHELVKTNDGSEPGAYTVLKLNQILHVPTGLYVCQQMHSSFWRVDDGALVKASLTSNDSCGNTFKLLEKTGAQWRYRYFTYWEGMSEGEEAVPAAAETVWYDELPARVRMLDFSKPSGEIAVHLIATMIQSKKGDPTAEPATIKWQTSGRTISVLVKHAGGVDRFNLDSAFPYLLRDWQQADGSELHLKRSLKIDYWNYSKIGDYERALATH